MTGAPQRDRRITVRPDFLQPRIKVGFPSPPKSQEDAEYTRTILASTPGCTEVIHHDGSKAFWVKLGSNDSEVKVAAQCFIEQAFSVPHLFACNWSTAGRERDQVAKIGYELSGFLFLEPVANSLASTLMAQLTAFFVQLETLHLDSHIFVARLGFNLPSTHKYMDFLTDVPIQVHGITIVEPWEQGWGLKELLAYLRNWQ